MKKILLMMMCLLISGCGLFKKTVKTSNSVENTSEIEVKSENSDHIKVEEEANDVVKSIAQNHNSSKTNSQVRKDVDENTEVTADNIEVASDGSLRASGNAKYIRKKKDQSVGSLYKVEKGSQVISNDSSGTKTTILDSKSKTKNNVKQVSVEKEKSSKTTSTPNFGWIIWVAIAAAMIFCGFILGKWLSKILKEKIKI